MTFLRVPDHHKPKGEAQTSVHALGVSRSEPLISILTGGYNYGVHAVDTVLHVQLTVNTLRHGSLVETGRHGFLPHAAVDA